MGGGNATTRCSVYESNSVNERDLNLLNSYPDSFGDPGANFLEGLLVWSQRKFEAITGRPVYELYITGLKGVLVGKSHHNRLVESFCDVSSKCARIHRCVGVAPARVTVRSATQAGSRKASADTLQTWDGNPVRVRRNRRD